MVDMMSILLIPTLVLFHFVGDFSLQTDFMKQYKQKKNWEKYGWKYRYDYIATLLVHSFEWSIFVHIPICIYQYLIYDKAGICLVIYQLHDSKDDALLYFGITVFLDIILQALVHFSIDNKKCNDLKLTLMLDQLFHMIQLFSMWILFLAPTS